jgi:hypothetical protein
MRIGIPSITRQGDRQVLRADLVVETPVSECPETLWFSTELEERCFGSALADAFVTGLIASAMRLGEDIRVEGAVSTRLAHGLETYQQVLNTWWPEFFQPIDIRYDHLEDRPQDPRPSGVGCTFSGGLDSFHAVHQMLPEQIRFSSFSITHALMINGFDQLYDPERQGLAQSMLDLYRDALGQWGVNLIMLDSNLKACRNATLGRPEQVHSYSGALAACAHALGGLFGRFGISGHATYAYNQLEPDGSHPAVDPLFSSDQLQIMHTGTTHSRSRKLELLADNPQVQKCLRVCFGPILFDPASGTPRNCCACEKCVRTMASLIIIDKLDDFPTFSNRRHSKKAYQNPDTLSHIDDHHLKDMTELARRHDKEDWVRALNLAREKRRVREGS